MASTGGGGGGGGGGLRAVRRVQALSGDFEHVLQAAHINNIRHAAMCDVYFSFSATLLKGLCAYT